MESKVQVSVIIPVYNAEMHLRECLESIVSQSLKDIEFICVDDGSTDSTPEILREYESKDSRVKVITQQNQYAGVARNRGMDAARGRYYAFMDADDYFEPFALELMLDHAERYQLDVLKAAFYNIQNGIEPYDTEYSVNGTLKKESFGKVLSFPDDLSELIQVADVPWNGLYRSDFLKSEKIEFNDFQCINDHSFFIQCVLKAKRFMVIDDHVVYHRENQRSSLVGQKAKHFECHLANYKLIRNFAEDLPLAQKKLLLRWEFGGTLNWYLKLRSETEKNYQEKMDEQLSEFLSEFDESDVGIVFLSGMKNRKLYYDFRKRNMPHNLRSGFGYLSGRLLSSLPEKIQNAFRYCDENGTAQLMKRFFSRERSSQK